MCPCCGYEAARLADAVEPPFRGTPECYAAYQELSAYTLTRGRKDFIHQEAVDAYAAQHPGPPAKPISTWFALVGLHLAVDQGRTGAEVQRAHMRLGRRKRTWPVLPPPVDLTCMRAADVLCHPAGDLRDEALLRWAYEVWQRWEAAQATIADWCLAEGL
jgi:hypothetical protein